MGLQLTGFAAVAGWTVVTITIAFLIIKAIFGLRVTEEEEITGLDVTEHGLTSAYSGFAIMDVSNTTSVFRTTTRQASLFGRNRSAHMLHPISIREFTRLSLSQNLQSTML